MPFNPTPVFQHDCQFAIYEFLRAGFVQPTGLIWGDCCDRPLCVLDMHGMAVPAAIQLTRIAAVAHSPDATAATIVVEARLPGIRWPSGFVCPREEHGVAVAMSHRLQPGTVEHDLVWHEIHRRSHDDEPMLLTGRKPRRLTGSGNPAVLDLPLIELLDPDPPSAARISQARHELRHMQRTYPAQFALDAITVN